MVERRVALSWEGLKSSQLWHPNGQASGYSPGGHMSLPSFPETSLVPTVVYSLGNLVNSHGHSREAACPEATTCPGLSYVPVVCSVVCLNLHGQHRQQQQPLLIIAAADAGRFGCMQQCA